MNDKFGIILLTGLPGVGKTTLIQNIYKELSTKHNICCNGFYTTEVRSRENRERIGFDVVSLKGDISGILARSNPIEHTRRPCIGKYSVYIEEFENIAMPLIKPIKKDQLLVVDEIGKMELLSKKFEASIKNCIEKCHILATVPYETRKPIALVERLKNHPNSITTIVTKENRNTIKNQILENILEMFK